MNADHVTALLQRLDDDAQEALRSGQGDLLDAFQVAALAIWQGAQDQGLDVPAFAGATFGLSDD